MNFRVLILESLQSFAAQYSMQGTANTVRIAKATVQAVMVRIRKTGTPVLKPR